MINKRLLVKNLLAHNDENSFYDKKRFIDIGQREGKAKFLKHVCALANSNPQNNSFIVIGVEDEDNEIIGVDFFDDSKIQNLVNAYLDNPPRITYENIPFPHLPMGKVVGLVTIKSNGKVCSLRKNIWKYYGGSVFFRDGSISMPKAYGIQLTDVNAGIVATIKKVKNETYYSRVDIELINEQVKLFFSEFDEITIAYDENSFTTIEYVQLGLSSQQKYYPLEKVVITFMDNGTYTIQSDLIFEPPLYDKKTLHHIYNANVAMLKKIEKEIPLTPNEVRDLDLLSDTFLICYVNGFEEAKDIMENVKPIMKKYNLPVYQSIKESLRIIRKMKYN